MLIFGIFKMFEEKKIVYSTVKNNNKWNID